MSTKKFSFQKTNSQAVDRLVYGEWNRVARYRKWPPEANASCTDLVTRQRKLQTQITPDQDSNLHSQTSGRTDSHEIGKVIQYSPKIWTKSSSY